MPQLNSFGGIPLCGFARERTEGRLSPGLANPDDFIYGANGAILRVFDQEVMPMEQFLLNIMAAIVAGVVVALFSRKLK